MVLTPVEAAALSVQARQLLGSPQATQAHGATAQQSVVSTSFSNLVSQGLSQVNDQLLGGQQELQRLALGEAASLHQVMTRLEEGRIAFQLMLQVRGRLLEAYQDLIKMPL